MSDQSSQKRGLFGWFGGNKSDKNPPAQNEDSARDQQDCDGQEIDTSLQDVETSINTASETADVQERPLVEIAATSDGDSELSNSVSLYQRLKSGLAKTRSQLSGGLSNLVLGQKEIDEDLLEEVETLLLMADVGVETTSKIVDDLTQKAERKELKDSQALMQRLQHLLLDIVEPVQEPLNPVAQNGPFVILMVGVNGVGKTTTIGKLAHQYINQGKSVMLAAGDTFRAAAVEQLTAWGERNQVPVIAQHTGADSASVIFDAVEAAKARQVDIVIADTAGRLHNKANLMEELSKVKRVISRIDPQAPHEVMLVVDAGTGQNALVQAVEFNKVVALDSVIITKLDGTAKGGVVFALADRMKLPIRFIGIGESKQDLRPFEAKAFVQALFSG